MSNIIYLDTIFRAMAAGIFRKSISDAESIKIPNEYRCNLHWCGEYEAPDNSDGRLECTGEV